jgi:hypothetical protein
MKRAIILLLILMPCVLSAQKVNEVLDVGPDEIIHGRAKFLLRFNGKNLEYDLWDAKTTRFRTLKDSTLFLSKQTYVLVYRRPVNPLNYSFESKLEFVPSVINQEADAALDIIAKSLTNFTKLTAAEIKAANTKALETKGTAFEVNPPEECKKFENIVTLLQSIEALLKRDQKAKVKEAFDGLKAMKFDREEDTKNELGVIAPKLDVLSNELNEVSKKIADVEDSISKYDCPLPYADPYIARHVFLSQVALLKTALKEQTERFKNLKKCFELVTSAYTEARGETEGIEWIVKVKVSEDNYNIDVKKKTVSNFLVTVNEDGYTLSDKNEIIAVTKKQKTKALVRVLKFQRFIPEVIPGAAYSFLQFPKFGVDTNAAGKPVVADAGNENFKRINFSAMVNFNFFVPQSTVHPFLQIGVGANTDYPSFFTGAGFRFDIGGNTVKAIAISGGMVSTWVKTLKTLKIGSEVKGTAELEKDITHEFKWPPKAYVGIQLKF